MIGFSAIKSPLIYIFCFGRLLDNCKLSGVQSGIANAALHYVGSIYLHPDQYYTMLAKRQLASLSSSA